MNLKPLGNRLVVEPIEEQDITAGGIVLPETAKEKPQKATVLAVGEGERNDKGERVTPNVHVNDPSNKTKVLHILQFYHRCVYGNHQYLQFDF